MQVLSSSPAAMYSNMSDAFTRITTTEGTKRLWRGVASVIMGAGPAHAVYFGTYELAKDFAGGNDNGYSFAATGKRNDVISLEEVADLIVIISASAGGLATIASDALMNPFDGVHPFTIMGLHITNTDFI